MRSYKDILNKKGNDIVKMYQQTLIDNDRVATGKTKDSIRYEVKEENFKVKFIVWAADHIRDLETGVTAQQFQAKEGADIFQQITAWANARGINKTANGIIRTLRQKGWNTDLPNRTGPNGGTAGLITNVDTEVTNTVLEEVKKGSKMLILGQLKTSSNGNNGNR